MFRWKSYFSEMKLEYPTPYYHVHKNGHHSGYLDEEECDGGTRHDLELVQRISQTLNAHAVRNV